METKRLRLAELAAVFAAADEEDYEDEDDTGVLPGEQVKALKDELKELKAAIKQGFSELKILAKDLFDEIKIARLLPPKAKQACYTIKGTQILPDFDSSDAVVGLALDVDLRSSRVPVMKSIVHRGKSALPRAATIDTRLARHKALEDEAKQLKADLRVTEKKQDELVAAARAKIGRDEARTVNMQRLHRQLIDTNPSYLRADQRACSAALENLHAKYAVTAAQIEARRDVATAKLKGFLAELGYA
jgi:type I restriction enzyme M protein